MGTTPARFAWAKLSCLRFSRAFVTKEWNPRFFCVTISSAGLRWLSDGKVSYRWKAVVIRWSPILLSSRTPEPLTVNLFPLIRQFPPEWLSLRRLRPTERPVKEILISDHDVPQIAAKPRTVVIPVEVLQEHNLTPSWTKESYKSII